MTHQDPTSAIARLLQIMRQLRDPATGCAWDREQTLESIIPHTLEETHELAEAVGQGAPDAIRDALYRQAFGPVRWVECVVALKARGATHIIECGPGKVLAGMVKRIDAELQSGAVFDPASLAETRVALGA